MDDEITRLKQSLDDAKTYYEAYLWANKILEAIPTYRVLRQELPGLWVAWETIPTKLTIDSELLPISRERISARLLHNWERKFARRAIEDAIQQATAKLRKAGVDPLEIQRVMHQDRCGKCEYHPV